MSNHPILKCGCVAIALSHGKPACPIHDCFEVADEQPKLEGRLARCTYYGKPVKTGMYNSNCCDKCKSGDVCLCEKPSSNNLWFFQHKPDNEFDEFYCACHGAD